jgi:colanic acid biosynthesis protein WcaH
MLDRETFKIIVDKTPLISIDLVVRNPAGEVLIGQRLNSPAQGFWFVPGGRILKDESLAVAFKRLTLNELGIAIDINEARYLGLYEHFYPESIFTGVDSCVTVSIHYVVNGFEIILPDTKHDLPVEQHGAYKWFSEGELLTSEEVHIHSKWYFDDNFGYLNE